MKNGLSIIWKDYYAWIIAQGAAWGMLMDLIVSPSLWKTFTPYAGYTAVSLLVLVLSLNPLKHLFPDFTVIRTLNRYRRVIGVSCFAYAIVHILCFAIKKEGNILPHVFAPAIIPAFWIAFPILLLMALTSNNYMVRKLGAIRWKNLHRFVYLVEIALFSHMMLMDKKLYALLFFIPLATVQIYQKTFFTGVIHSK